MIGELLLQIIQSYGVPVAIMGWYMWRIEGRLSEIEKDNHKQTVILSVLVRVLSKGGRAGTIPEEFTFEEITGVTEIPEPTALKQLQEKSEEKTK